ncbi:MAG: 50S ribosomal protein L4 [Candidatus Pacebacteria bacterium]|nr:50S ribosomal protein L4 [Candidatus Paceibacterota bacterium]
MKLAVYDRTMKQVGDVEVSDAIFGRPWNPDLIHQIVVAMAANRRQPLAHTKQRDEVSGGGKKPWRQKGTGRARHGSTRSPLWKGGGATFGPRNDRDYTQKINKKMVRAGVYVALSKKIADGEFKVIDTLAIKEPRTRELKWVPKSTLLIPAIGNKDIFRASANIQKVKALDPQSLNVEDLLKFKTILIDREAVMGIK